MADQPTYKKTEALSLDIVEAINPFRFVSHLGSLCGAGLLAAGVSETALEASTKGSVITAQTALLLIKEQLALGDQVASDADGCGVKAGSGDFVNAIALSAGVTNMKIEVDLKSYLI